MDVINVFDVSPSPVSMIWIGTIFASSISVYFNVLSPTKFTFATARLKQEPWRILLTFCFLGPPLVGLVQNCYFVAKTVGLLEEVYVFSLGVVPQAWTRGLDETLRAKAREIIAQNRTRDFGYFMIQLGLSIAFTVWLLSYFGVASSIYFLGPPLQRVMLYIRCRLYPDQDINIMGIEVKSKYAFLASQLLEFLISPEYFKLMTLFPVNPSMAVLHLFSSQILYEAFLEFCIGHFWWYLRYFYLDVMYNDSQDEWNIAYSKERQENINFQEILRHVVTPFWYKKVMKKIMLDQLLRVLFGSLGEDGQVPHTVEEMRELIQRLGANSRTTNETPENNDDAADEAHNGDTDGQGPDLEFDTIPAFEGTTGMNVRGDGEGQE